MQGDELNSLRAILLFEAFEFGEIAFDEGAGRVAGDDDECLAVRKISEGAGEVANVFELQRAGAGLNFGACLLPGRG